MAHFTYTMPEAQSENDNPLAIWQPGFDNSDFSSAS